MPEPKFDKILEEYERKGMGRPTTQQPGSVIHRFDDIPDITTLDVAPAEPVVDGLLYSGSMTLLAGADGSAKTFLAQVMSVAVGKGETFLSRQCRRTPVLYLDYENPGYAVKDRLDVLTGLPEEPQPLECVKFWGTWLEHQPPQVGSDLLLQICRDTKPLLIVDPLRYAHDGEENDSGEMMLVMRSLRSYAAAGATVLVLHHVAKTEGSTYRGSTALRGAFDVAYVQEVNEETGLLTLKCVKNRFGDKPTVFIRPDFEAGIFEVTDSPAWTKRQADVERLLQIIAGNPGLKAGDISRLSSIRKSTCLAHLKAHDGKLWRSERGQGKAVLYFPLLVPTVPIGSGNRGNHRADGPPAHGSLVPPLIGGTSGNQQGQVAVPRTNGSHQKTIDSTHPRLEVEL